MQIDCPALIHGPIPGIPLPTSQSQGPPMSPVGLVTADEEDSDTLTGRGWAHVRPAMSDMRVFQ